MVSIVSIVYGVGRIARKAARICLSALFGSLFISAILISLLFARLSFGPLDLSAFNPQVKNTFANLFPENKIHFSKTSLLWKSWYIPLELQVNDILMSQQAGDPIHLGTVSIGVNMIDLMQGSLKISHVDFIAPRIILNELPLLPTTSSTAFNYEGFLETWASLLKNHPTLSKLNTISVSQADLLIKNKAHFQNFDFILLRKKDHLSIELKLPENNHQVSSLRCNLEIPFQNNGQLTVKAHLDNFNPAEESERLRPLLPEALYNELQKFNLPFSGKVESKLDPQFFQDQSFIQALEHMEGTLDLHLGKGVLQVSQWHPDPIQVVEGHSNISLSNQKGEIKECCLILKQTPITHTSEAAAFQVNLKGTIEKDENHQKSQLKIDVKAQNFNMDGLKTWWPVSIAPAPRGWIVANLTKGTIPETQLTLSGNWLDSSADFVLDSLAGYIDFKNLTVRYIDELPPVTSVSGRANFDHAHFDININEGSLGALKLTQGHVLIPGLDQPDQSLHLSANVKGPLQAALLILDQKPLEFLKPYGIDPKKTQGQAEVGLKIDFPLEKRLSLDKVQVDTKAKLSQVTLQDFELTSQIKPTFKTGTLDLALTTHQMELNGTLFLENNHLQVNWYERFVGNKNTKPQEKEGSQDNLRFLKVETTLSNHTLKSVGVNLGPYLQGAVKLKATYKQELNLQGTLKAEADLRDAAIEIPILNWHKPKEGKGTANLTITTAKGQPPQINAFVIKGPDLHLEGKGQLTPKGDALARLEVPYFTVGHSHFGLKVEHTLSTGYRLSIVGPELDIESLYDQLFEDEENTAVPQELEINLDLGVLRLGEGRLLRKVRGALKSNGQTWHDVRLRGQLDPQSSTSTPAHPKATNTTAQASALTVERIAGDSHYKTTIIAKNGGEFLRVFNLYDDIIGGDLKVTLNRPLKTSGSQNGRIKLKNFHVRNAPLLTRLLSLAAPTGVVDLLSGQGMGFHKFTSDFALTPQQVNFKNGLAVSLGLGISISGTVGRINSILSLKGNVIPAYAVNSIVGKIPIIGELLSGGSGEGIFAASFTIKGTTDKPLLSVNPVSVFTPGFIRKIFEEEDEEDK